MSLPRLILLLVLTAGVAHDYVLLRTTGVAVGVDGYYYVLQVTQLAQSGRLYFPTLKNLGRLQEFYKVSACQTAFRVVVRSRRIPE